MADVLAMHRSDAVMSPFSGDLQMDEQWHIIVTMLTKEESRLVGSSDKR
jgi:hypothetical protein